MIENIEFVLACGGQSTRNYPQSKGLAHKGFLPFGSVRLIDYILQQIFAVGGKYITIVCRSEDVKKSFQEALAPSPEVEQKVEKRGHPKIAQAIRSTRIPEGVQIRYVIQEQPLGTAHVLALAHEQSPDRHMALIFPDDVHLPEPGQPLLLQALADAFLADPKQILLTTIPCKDVSAYAIVHNNRIIEKPSVAYNLMGVFSPMFFPKACLDHIVAKWKTYRPEEPFFKGEWFYTDASNDFMDEEGLANGYKITTFARPNALYYMDVGNLPNYEHALLFSLLTMSLYKDEHIQFIKQFLSDLDKKNESE
ncbi:MAG: hypothetical protein ILP11_03265 [Alphaproteobacteria bacterium]|nr:hypothetical protein [Alphaproteobacteria bacterium]